MSDEWHADEKRRRRIQIFGPTAWYVALAFALVDMVWIIVAIVVGLFRAGASGVWFGIAITLAAVAVAIALPAALAWVWHHWEEARRPHRPTSHREDEALGDAWTKSLSTAHEDFIPEEQPHKKETDIRIKSMRYQWISLAVFLILLLAFIVVFFLVFPPGAPMHPLS